MTIELDIHSLPDSHSHYGRYLPQTADCEGCPFRQTIVNRDWADKHERIGSVCAWGREWKWIKENSAKVRSCRKLRQPTPPDSISAQIEDIDFTSLGVSQRHFDLSLFRQVVSLYTKNVGGELPKIIEHDYGYVKDELEHTNAVSLRYGSYVSEHSKLEVEWRYPRAEAAPRSTLYFHCYPNTSWGAAQGEYLNSRFELAVNKLLEKMGIGVPIK